MLSSAVREFATATELLAAQHGGEVQRILGEALWRQPEEQRRLAERLQESVAPLFMKSRFRQPERIGSCVLVHLDSGFYVFTAAHVIRDAGSATLLAPSEGRGGKLLPLRPCTAYLNFSERAHDLDVGVLVMPASQLGPFQHHVFLGDSEIDRDDRPDDRGFQSFYFVLGYSASRTQVKVSRTERRIHQQSFQCSTQPVDAAEYLQQRTPEADHILLDFDHKEIVLRGKRVTPPSLQGVSGGGIFHVYRDGKCTLVAIATENLRNSRLIVGTRIKHFLTIVRELAGERTSL